MIDYNNKIAVIGFSGQFPGANDCEQFWNNLEAGICTISDFPTDRWESTQEAQLNNKIYVNKGGFIDNIYAFDPLFFNMSGHEAERSDPQHRLFLQESWRSIECAGYNPEELSGRKIGVFVGANAGDYIHKLTSAGLSLDAHSSVGNSASLLSARIAYHLDFHGPCITIDTACSSSLVAFHLACQSICNDECELALAGGVFLSTTPLGFTMCSSTQILSPDGLCKAFAHDANGFVLSEGVNVVFLKKLSAAIRDRDYIYGVILGSGVNQDGKTNGITAPSTKSQTALQTEVYLKAGVNPDDISYIEAHGTGTQLGDPIEIEALTNAFSIYTSEKSYCAIGSVKTNIGHGAFSSGIAGLIKVLLCLEHKKLVPTLHCTKTNPLIDFSSTPFYLSKTLHTWLQRNNKPRLAAINSFGWSGTNAHVLVQEMERNLDTRAIVQPPFILITLSAKCTYSLRQKCIDLLNYCKKHQGSLSLFDMAYTLAVGRGHYGYRCAFIVNSWLNLQSELEKIIISPSSDKCVEMSELSSNVVDKIASKLWQAIQTPTLFLNYLKMTATVYLSGKNLDWNIFYRTQECLRLPLPTYPFQNNSYCLKGHTKIPSISINPLTITFEKVFHRDEWVFQDHKIEDIPTLPGAVVLEVIMTALVENIKIKINDCHWKDIIWVKPIQCIKDIVKINGRLQRSSNDDQSFKYQLFQDDGSLVAQGELALHINSSQTQSFIGLIENVKSLSCTEIKVTDIYELLRCRGLQYGPYLCVLQQLWITEDHILGKLSVNMNDLEESNTGFHIDPRLIDGALQTASVGIARGDDQIKLMPFTIEELIVYKILPNQVYTLVEKSSLHHGSDFIKFTVMIIDELGQILAICKNVCSKKSSYQFQDIREDAIDAKDSQQVIYCKPEWQRLKTHCNESSNYSGSVIIFYPILDLDLSINLSKLINNGNCIRVLLGQEYRKISDNHFEINSRVVEDYLTILNNTNSIAKLYFLGAIQPFNYDDDITVYDEKIDKTVLCLLYLLQAMTHYSSTLVLSVITNDAQQVFQSELCNPYGSAVQGLARVASRELTKHVISVIDISSKDLNDSDASRNKLLKFIINYQPSEKNLLLAHRYGICYQQQLSIIDLHRLSISEPLSGAVREQGVYLIIGGAGGIGRVMAQYLVKKGARVALIGRSPLDQEKEEFIQRLNVAGDNGFYIQGDVTVLDDMNRVLVAIKQRWGSINGVIFSALTLQDSSILRMTKENFNGVFSVKALGSMVLAHALKNESLDWLVFFSSGNSLTCNSGQCNYVAGCCFQDVYAHYLIDRYHWNVKLINWGYWGNVGVVATPYYLEKMKKLGVKSISCDEGIIAFERSLRHSAIQVMPIKATKELLMSAGVNFDRKIAIITDTSVPVLQHIIPEIKKITGALQGIISPKLVGFDEVEKWACDRFYYMLQKHGLFCSPEDTYQFNELSQHFSVMTEYQKLWRVLLTILEKEKYISIINNSVQSTKSLGAYSIDILIQQKQTIINRHPEYEPHLMLLESCIDAYPNVVSGKRKASDVLFPDSSMKLVEKIYKNNPQVDYFNQLVTESIKHIFIETLKHGLPSQVKIRILEIGAGTGGTTAPLIHMLQQWSEMVDYHYTDISLAFTQHGKRTWGHLFPFLQFKLLDINKDIEQQGYECGFYDIIIAANVLHATSNMNETLNQVKKLAKKSSLLILNEGTTELYFATMTFGLTKGWWSFEDTDIRSGIGPLLSVQQWQGILTETGWKNISVFGGPGVQHYHEDMQHVIICESNGEYYTELSKEDKQRYFETIPNIDIDNTSSFILEKSRVYFIDVFSKVLRIDDELITTNTKFANYGVDSLVSITVTEALEVDFGKLSKTLLFEHDNIESLITYFIENHRDKLLSIVNVNLHENSNTLITTLSDQVDNTETVMLADSSTKSPIAIIGIACRFPKAKNKEQFWDNLKNGRNCITPLPHERRKFGFGELIKENVYSGGFIDDMASFDPLFFNISPREARMLDPQERIFLETAWLTIEDAGYTPERLQSHHSQGVGVYVGVMYGEYQCLGAKHSVKDSFIETHSAQWSIANRVSYSLNFTGPSLAIDTACSSSLTAVAMACDSIHRGECAVALAGGVNLILRPEHYLWLERAQMLSGNGYCSPFSADADGIIPGEGVGTVLLKPLDQAIKDGDNIYAVIRGHGINHGGKSHGFTVPNMQQQAKLISNVLKSTCIDPRKIHYIEAHGTGTPLGDPIEINGLIKAFRQHTHDDQFCAIGSIKSNIGHLESAAGIASLIKVVLQFQYGELVPSINVNEVNPEIQLAGTPFYLQTKLSKLPKTAYNKCAGISSFGAGGLNVHMLIEEYHRPLHDDKLANTETVVLVILSAKNTSMLKNKVNELIIFLQNNTISLNDMAYTLQIGRVPMNERLAIIANDFDDLLLKLKTYSKHQHRNDLDSDIQVGNSQIERIPDDQTQQAISKGLTYKDYQLLATLWTKGFDIDWNILYQQHKPSRVSLPGYNFLNEIYWFTDIELATHPDRFPQDIPTIQHIESVICQVLELSNDTSLSQPFFELGVDSILASQLVVALNQSFGTDLVTTDLYNYPDLKRFYPFFTEQFAARDKIVTQCNSNSSMYPETKTDIAIIGIACCFPGAKNANEYWKLLENGQCAITNCPPDRENVLFNMKEIRGGFIDDYQCFDPLFFNLSPKEAESMDPQQRLFLETSWHAIEDAGYSVESLDKSCNIYIGVAPSYYQTSPNNSMSVMGNSNAILPARLAYFLNLQGGASAIDTACSSSLVAIHQACQSLIAGEAKISIAGGVSCTLFRKEPFEFLIDTGMYSTIGQCQAFDDAADGFIPAEGVGIVLLKPLDAAIADRNTIYGVIKGSAINQDGKSNGLTAPNALSQTNLIRSLYEKIDINPESLSYVEMHGTGTKLGDPIEIEGITSAFRNYTNAKQICGIGSSKSNIGHALAAAGVAGLIKIILSLKHKKLPPSIHYKNTNRNIDLANSPFFVVDKLTDWIKPVHSPRRAALSSFGFSGTNCHMVIEEFNDQQHTPNSVLREHVSLITLSAKRYPDLLNMANNLRSWLKNDGNMCSLTDLSFTLNCCRTHFPKRLAWVVSNIQELMIALEHVTAPGYIFKDYSSNKSLTSTTCEYLISELLTQKCNEITYRTRLIKLSECYLAGNTINWEALYAKTEACRLSTPGYPFSRKRYASQHTNDKKKIHPLIDTYLIDADEHVFYKDFSMNDSIIRDHKISNQYILPGAAQIEMIRVSLSLISEITYGLYFKQITWLRPIIINTDEIKIELRVRGMAEHYHASISTLNGDDIIENTICDIELFPNQQGNAILNVSEIKARCEETSNRIEVYQFLQSIGYDYGKSLQAVEQWWYNDHESLSLICIEQDDSAQYPVGAIHPSTLDAAIQTITAIGFNKKIADKCIPFSIKQLIQFSTLPSRVYAYCKKLDKKNDNLAYDIVILEESGNILVQIDGLSLRKLQKNSIVRTFNSVDLLGTFYQPYWELNPLAKRSDDRVSLAKPNVVILVTNYEGLPQYIPEHSEFTRIIQVKLGEQFQKLNMSTFEIKEYSKIIFFLDYSLNNSTQFVNELFHPLFLFTQELFSLNSKNDIQVVNLLKRSPISSLISSTLTAFARSLWRENHSIQMKCLAIEEDVSTSSMLSFAMDELFDESFKVEEIKLRKTGRYVKHILEVPLHTKNPHLINLPLKKNGVYLITGGGGHIGYVLSQFLASSYHATLIWLGRSEVNQTLITKMSEIESLGGKVKYYVVDVCDESRMFVVKEDVKRLYGNINGVIHAAGKIDDGIIAQKSLDSFEQVLLPKITGTVVLDKVTASEPLDFFFICSSLASVVGSSGQADYAAANGFMDEYANYRNQNVADGHNYGVTISVNWPLWRPMGMRPKEGLRTRQFDWVDPLSNNQGIAIFNTALELKLSSLIYFQGITEQFNNQLSLFTKIKSNDKVQIKQNAHHETTQLIKHKLLNILSEMLHLEDGDITVDQPMSEYGFDSITLTVFANKINVIYNIDFSPAELFGQKSLIDLIDYLLQHYETQITSYHHADPGSTITVEYTPKIPKLTPEPDNAIAVIGIAGVFPCSSNLDDFWNNLFMASDMVSQIPEDRFNWKQEYQSVKDMDPTLIPNMGGFIHNVDKFDADYFKISRREANLMDPQQRKFMELAIHCIENAGYAPSSLAGTQTGVYVGVSTNDYAQLLSKTPDVIGHGLTGISPCIIPNRVSYLLDLHGPSEAIDTACSSSLVAVHHAVQSLLTGECQMALAGGINIILSPTPFIAFSRAGMLSPDSRCRCLDKNANGYVRGEGGGVVLLKSLRAALADNDHIHAVIKGIAMNHGGHAQNLTAPNPISQTNVIKSALYKANVDSSTISYIELHGTGTTLGDSVEIEGLTQAFEKSTSTLEKHCGLGSVKSNMGHLEPAAGIAGLIKIILSLKHKTIPATLHINELNPYLKLDRTPFYPVYKTKAWEPMISTFGESIPRRAGISSFGFGGVNVHAIVEEYDNHNAIRGSTNLPPYLYVLSAKSHELLFASIKQLSGYIKTLDNHHDHFMQDLAYTLQVGRDQFPLRIALIASDKVELLNYINIVTSGNLSIDNVFHNLDSGISNQSSELNGSTQLNEMSLFELAQHWVDGYHIKWKSLTRNTNRHRLSLPGYPFIKNSYWYNAYDKAIDKAIKIDVNQIRNRCPKRIPSTKPDIIAEVLTNHEELLATIIGGTHSIDHVEQIFHFLVQDVWHETSSFPKRKLSLDWKSTVNQDMQYYLYMQKMHVTNKTLFNLAMINSHGQIIKQAAAVNFF